MCDKQEAFRAAAEAIMTFQERYDYRIPPKKQDLDVEKDLAQVSRHVGNVMISATRPHGWPTLTDREAQVCICATKLWGLYEEAEEISKNDFNGLTEEHQLFMKTLQLAQTEFLILTRGLY